MHRRDRLVSCHAAHLLPRWRSRCHIGTCWHLVRTRGVGFTSGVNTAIGWRCTLIHAGARVHWLVGWHRVVLRAGCRCTGGPLASFSAFRTNPAIGGVGCYSRTSIRRYIAAILNRADLTLGRVVDTGGRALLHRATPCGHRWRGALHGVSSVTSARTCTRRHRGGIDQRRLSTLVLFAGTGLRQRPGHTGSNPLTVLPLGARLVLHATGVEICKAVGARVVYPGTDDFFGAGCPLVAIRRIRCCDRHARSLGDISSLSLVGTSRVDRSSRG